MTGKVKIQRTEDDWEAIFVGLIRNVDTMAYSFQQSNGWGTTPMI